MRLRAFLLRAKTAEEGRGVTGAQLAPFSIKLSVVYINVMQYYTAIIIFDFPTLLYSSFGEGVKPIVHPCA